MELATVIALLEQYRYIILFPIACIEGPMVAFLAGSLAALGYFNIFVLLPVLVLADVGPDIAYYFAGRYGGGSGKIARAMGRIGLTPERLEVVRDLWHRHPMQAMLITKFSYGL